MTALAEDSNGVLWKCKEGITLPKESSMVSQCPWEGNI